MERKTHAALGAITLRNAGHNRALIDAARLISLGGSTTGSGQKTSAAHTDPIAAARSWLADPVRRRQLDAELVARAEASLEVAAAHHRELDLLAADLASDARITGQIDGMRLAHAEQMADLLRVYSDRMRGLIDPEAPDPNAVERLERAMAAAARGGLPAFIAAL